MIDWKNNKYTEPQFAGAMATAAFTGACVILSNHKEITSRMSELVVFALLALVSFLFTWYSINKNKRKQ